MSRLLVLAPLTSPRTRPSLATVTHGVSHEASSSRPSSFINGVTDVSMANDGLSASSSQSQTLPFHPRTRPAGLDPTTLHAKISQYRLPAPFHNSFQSRQLRSTHPPPSPIRESDMEAPIHSAEGQSPNIDTDVGDGMDVDVNDASHGVNSMSLAATGDEPNVGGKRFVMGYFDDCSKCRARVPGHFNHFR